VVHHGAALDRESGSPALTEAVTSAEFDRLPERMAALCRYGLKLMARPWEMMSGDVDALRRAGCADRDVGDANQVASYFNDVNRVADGLGVELEPERPESAQAPRRYRIGDRSA
jgi:uncharacterized protein YciW